MFELAVEVSPKESRAEARERLLISVVRYAVCSSATFLGIAKHIHHLRDAVTIPHFGI